MTVEQRHKVIDYLVIITLLVVVTGVCKASGQFFNITDVAMLYLLPIIYAGARTDTWISVATAITSVLLFDFLFVPPFYNITVEDAHYVFTFAILLVVGVTISSISNRLRKKKKETEAALDQTRVMYELSTELTAVSNVDEFSRIIVSVIADATGNDAVLYLPDGGDKLALMAASNPQGRLATDKNEGGVAGWVFEQGQDAGPGTDTLPGAMGFYAPLKLEDEILGVLGIDVSEGSGEDLLRKNTLLLAFAGLSTLALHKLLLMMAAQHVKNLEASEKLRSALFDSVSHELRTPLASIIGAVTSLTGSKVFYTDEQKNELLGTIYKGAARMDRLVRNLLDMARLESDSFKLKTEWGDIQDVIGVALATFSEDLEGRPTVVKVEDDLPLLMIDFELIVQVLINLVDNALKYSPPGSEIEITAKREVAGVVVSVEDQGPEIPHEDLSRVFDKFYRIEIPGTADGSGLGLSICKSIIDVHGGGIWAETKPGDGNRFVFSLPVGEHEPEGGSR